MRPAHPCDLDTVRRVIADMIAAARGDNPFAIYRFVRGRFVWFDRDGTDVFRGVAETLVAEGVCRFETCRTRDGKQYERFESGPPWETRPPPP